MEERGCGRDGGGGGYGKGLMRGRFVMEDITTVQGRIGSEQKGLEKDTEDLKKKFHYLETTFEKTQEHMKNILSGGRG